MSKDFNSQTLEGAAEASQQIQVQVEDAHAPTTYSSLTAINGTPEEVIISFAGPLKPTGPKTAVMKVEQRIILSPWAAKRLALILTQTLQRYEQAYGQIELDERARRVANPAPSGGLSGKPN